MKMKLLIGTVLLLTLGLAATAQPVRAAEPGAAIVAADAVQLQCPGLTPRGQQIGPRDGTRGLNAPRDGRGPGRGQGIGPRDGRGPGRGQGIGPRDGRGPGRGQARGGGQRQGPRDGSGPNCAPR